MNYLSNMLKGCVFSLIFALAMPVQSAQLRNALLDHPAPYVALHGNDPVAWQQYDRQAIEHARQEDKLLFVSVGYFACHWCHVMQQESYQDPEVAEVLNQSFVSIKVDRELEPALDSRLMEFAHATLGRGGWPLNVFLTPEGHPIFALLYVPKEQFLEVLRRLQQVWATDPDKIRSLVAREASSVFAETGSNIDVPAMQLIIDSAPAKLLEGADKFQGGFGDQAKFPAVIQLEFLLDQYERTGDSELRDFLEQTLDAMASQGMHDHISGGFFRYTVDPGWEIPHFEKMLYDNAALAAIYIRAAKVLDHQDYHQIARRTLDFMQDYMWLDQAFVSSFSAVDDQSIEGGHYLWEREQLQKILTEQEYKLVADLWGLDRPDELEAGNLPRWQLSVTEHARKSSQPASELLEVLDSARRKMLEVRKLRSLPVDDKLVAGWNGLALTAFTLGVIEYDDESYRQTASSLGSFLRTKMWNGERMTRALAKGHPHGTVSLEDFAYVAKGLWDWAQISGDQADQRAAEAIARKGWQVFYQNNAWYLEDNSLLVPPEGSELVEDGPTPSPSGVLIGVSFDIASTVKDEEWLEAIHAALNRGQRQMSGAPYWFVSQMRALQTALDAQASISTLE